jgi:HEAT repeats
MNSTPSLGEKLNEFQIDQIWRGNLLEILCNPQRFETHTAISAARQLMERYPNFDTRLVKELMDLPDVATGKDRRIERCLEIVDAVSSGRRIIMPLMRLMNSENPRIRSKVARILGRRAENGAWTRKLESEVDPRTRANIIESLWGSDSPEIREVLRQAMEDGDNRVRGNAILGLYRLGVVSVLPAIRALAENEASSCRATAAWLMGATGDARFRGILKKLREDPAANVRAAALRALVQLNKAGKDECAADREPIICFTDDLEGVRRVCFTLPKSDGDSPVPLATDVVLTENGEVIWDYVLAERRLSPVVALFLICEGQEPGTLPDLKDVFLRCLEQKETSDRWSFAKVGAATDGNSQGPRSIPTPFQGPELKEAIGRLDQLPSVATDQLNKLARLVGNTGIGRHVVLLLTPSSALSDGDVESIESAALALQFSVDVVCFTNSENPRLQKLARQTNGIFVRTPENGISPEFMISVYAAMAHRYEVTYTQSGASPAAPEITIRTPHGENTVGNAG